MGSIAEIAEPGFEGGGVVFLDDFPVGFYAGESWGWGGLLVKLVGGWFWRGGERRGRVVMNKGGLWKLNEMK